MADFRALCAYLLMNTPLLMRPMPAPQSATGADERFCEAPDNPNHRKASSPITVDVSASSVRPRISHVCRPQYVQTLATQRSGGDRVARAGTDPRDEGVGLTQVCGRQGTETTEHALYCRLNGLRRAAPRPDGITTHAHARIAHTSQYFRPSVYQELCAISAACISSTLHALHER